jgi:hypothetical protein
MHLNAGPNQSTPTIDIQGGSNISILNSHFTNNGGGTTTGAAIKIGVVSAISVIGNQIMDILGTYSTGIQIVTGAANFTITNNDLAQTTTPISWTPVGETAIVHDNRGVDNLCPTVVSANPIAIPNAATCINLTGSVGITNISGSQWSNRQVRVITPAGVALGTGGAANTKFCTAITTAAFQSILLIYDAVDGCWSHVP